ncbi:hypothetical protein IT41_00325 [Paracoccus halophilus]|uniref:P-type Zn(2+) transporter n=1 Tax=Paracoccus halophilus TaxID=376733 RepID=A0A099F8V4_9RHOB|nr:hypothetical protein IT41_00325 [Paracoccus halophilus]
MVHEIPGRLRLRVPALALPMLDAEQLAGKLRSVAGVQAVRINTDAASITIGHDGTEDTRARILDRIGRMRRADLKIRHHDDEGETSPAALVLRLATLAALPVLPARLGQMLGAALIAPRVLKGVRSLVTEGVTVELLDALAVSIGALRGGIGTAMTTDLMMGTGEYLEDKTMQHSTALLQDMLMPNPETAWVERAGGPQEVPFAEVLIGDLVVVGTGERVPVDGVVRSGRAQVNEASVTGESVPVGKEPGDAIIAGSLIETGHVRVEAQQVGDATTTAQIARLLLDSLGERSQTERLAQKHADRQVYMTLGLGAATLALTRDLRRLSSVFLVDYACPIKLSAPVAVRATMSDAVARGVLIKGGRSIEKLAEADTFVFDKTGTLTHGTLTVTDVVPLLPDEWPQDRLLALAASVEEHSNHPIARAIVTENRQRGAAHLDHDDVTFEIGHGLRASVGGTEALIGSRNFLQRLEGVNFDRHDAAIEHLAGEGKMLLYIALGGKPAGLVGLRDELRHDAADTARRLRGSGVKTLVMLTGDRAARAQAFGRDLGFDQVHAELRPEDKLRILDRLQAAGHRVAFIGDGVNDAPALARADVGLSMPLGADIAQAAADVLLLDDRIGAVADARDVSRQAMRIISSNSTIAIGFNSALFLAASLGLLSPVAAALMHNGSTIALLVSAIARAGLPPDQARRQATIS